MNRNVQIRIAKMIMSLSFILIFTGLYLYVEDSNKIIDPIKDTKVISNKPKDVISITTVEDKPYDDSTNNSVGNSSANKDVPSNNEVVSNNKDGASSNNNTNNDINKDTGKDTNNGTNNDDSNQDIIPNEPVIKPPTIEETNNKLRGLIQDRYGVLVRYGSETTGYSVGGLGTVSMSDEQAIQNALNSLAGTLALYPSGFFKEMNNQNLSLTIYLIEKYSVGNVTGVTDHSSRNVVISIASSFSIEDSLNHEIFHYIDFYIELSGGKYNSWNNYNPGGFSYGNINSSFSYNKTFSEDAFFVNNYAQTDEFEDRASTFEYMMAPVKASCLNYGRTVWLKAKYMAEQVDYFYNAVSPDVTEYWERFIY